MSFSPQTPVPYKGLSSLSFSRGAVCHEVPEEPVLSPVSGRVFERRLVTKWVQDNGTDPVSGEPLSVEQLMTINGKLLRILGVNDRVLTFDPQLIHL